MHHEPHPPAAAVDFGPAISEMARLLRHLADRAEVAAELGFFPEDIHCHLSSALAYIISTEELLWTGQVVLFSYERMALYLCPQAFEFTFVHSPGWGRPESARSQLLEYSDLVNFMPPHWPEWA